MKVQWWDSFRHDSEKRGADTVMMGGGVALWC